MYVFQKIGGGWSKNLFRSDLIKFYSHKYFNPKPFIHKRAIGLEVVGTRERMYTLKKQTKLNLYIDTNINK